MKNEKVKEFLLFIGIFSVLLTIGGLTFAWFTTSVTGDATSAVVTTANLGTTVVSGVNITPDGSILPGWISSDGTLQISNDDLTSNVEYTCYVRKNNNDIPDLEYRMGALGAASSTGGEWTSIVGSGRQGIIRGTLTPENKTHTYKVGVRFKETGLNQNEQQGKSTTVMFECDLSKTESYEILTGAHPSDEASVNVVSNTGLNYSNISSVSNGQGLYYEQNNEGSIYFFRGGDICSDGTSETKEACETAGEEWLELKNNIILGDKCYQIIRTNIDGSIRVIYNGTATDNQCISTGITHVGQTTFNYTTTIGSKTYMVSSDRTSTGYMFATPVGKTYQDGYGSAYAFNSTISSTHKVGTGYTMNTETGEYTLTGVSTAGTNAPSASGYKYTCLNTSDTCYYLYEIVSVESLGSGSYTLTSGIIHGGYYTASKPEAQSNEESSNLKIKLEEWYVTNIIDAGLDSYISDSGFCGDRTTTGVGYGRDIIGFAGYYRLIADIKNPTYECSQNDLYTKENPKGNQSIEYPVGTITADEYIKAGNGYNPTTNTNNYLKTSYHYWTMTPCYFNTTVSNGRVFYIVSSGFLNDRNVNNSSLLVRPVINISDNSEIVSGIGTKGNPYIVGTT